MMTKLLKHEYLRTRGLVILILGVAAGLGLGGDLLAWIEIPVISQLGIVTSAVAMILVVPGVQLYLGINYWMNSYRAQGYFTQTLPVRGSTIYWAKLVWGAIVTLAATIVAGIILLGFLAANDLFALWDMMWNQWNSYVTWWLWVIAAIVAIFYLFYLLVSFFFMATIGSVEPLNRWGIGGPIVVGIGTYFAVQILMIVSTFVIPLGVEPLESGHLGITSTNLIALIQNDAGQLVPIGWIPMMIVVQIVMLVWTKISWDRGASLV